MQDGSGQRWGSRRWEVLGHEESESEAVGDALVVARGRTRETSSSSSFTGEREGGEGRRHSRESDTVRYVVVVLREGLGW